MGKFAETVKTILTKRSKNGIMMYKNTRSCFSYMCREGIKKNMDVKYFADYLIDLFWNTRINGKPIECTRTKIGKLLTIVQILYIKHYKTNAFEDIIVEETCGTSIPVLAVHRYPYNIWDAYTESLNGNDFFKGNNPINVCEISKRADIAKNPFLSLCEDGELADRIIKLISGVFYEFGTYDGYEIGKLINEFKDKICSDNVVLEQKVIDWLSDNEDTGTNPIVDFINKHTF